MADVREIGLKLIRFGFGTAVLMADSVFVEHLGHLFGDHVTIVLNGNERDFFSHLGHGLGSRTFGTLGWTFWCLTHRHSIH